MKPLPVVAVAAALFAASAAVAPAQEPVLPARTAPVSVIACALSAPVPVLLSEGGTMSAGPALLLIDFVNHASVDATSVRFRVSSGSGVQTIEDTGRFSGGAVIERQLVPSFINPVAGPASCDVIGVGFADGSSWDAETAVRPFDPSAPGALSVGQMSAAWAHEIARIFPELGGGGG